LTDVYHVHCTKAALGKAAALGDFLKAGDSSAPMPGHFIVLRDQYLAISRYNSWQDFATDQAATANDSGWADIRQHGSYHHDTLADRLAPR
jgi:hypothetical protein